MNGGNQMSLLNASQIMEIIPHRQPFMLLDTVEELEPGKKGCGTKVRQL